MRISADLEKLKQHQDYLHQELHVVGRLLDSLDRQYRMAVEVSEDAAAFYLRHIRFVQDLQARTRQRSKLLSDAIDTLSEAKQIMTQKTSDLGHILRKID